MNEVDRRTLIAGASIVGAAALVRAARADLNPPAGPVQPTGRSLKDIEPRTPLSSVQGNPDYVHVISQPGSYYLTGDVVVPSGRRGILVLVTSGSVTLDLNGFAIRGTSGGLGAVTCPTPGPDYLEICDGYIRDFDGDGIDSGGARMLECDDLYIDHCSTGIVARSSACVHYCTFTRCAVDGVCWDKTAAQAPTQFIVDDCECRGCGRHGVCVLGDWSAGDGALVITGTDCVGNTGDGIHCTILSSSPVGSSLSISIDECRCCSNGGFGHRSSTLSQPGTTGARVVCTLDGLDCSSNSLGGMRVFNCHVDAGDCDCSSNNGDGFMMDTVTGSVDRCTASRNAFSGIHMIGACRCCVSDSACHSNSRDGVLTDLGCSGVSITECDCQANTSGFHIQSGGNSLLWNTASSNANNFTVSPALPIAIISGGELSTSCNPHANYSL